MHLKDESAPQNIRDYVRNLTDVHVYEYVPRGAVGEVYFAHRKKLKDDVVLKFYYGKEDYDSSEEAVILRNIDHPNLLKVIDLKFVAPSYALFTSHKIKDGDLQGLIDNGPISTYQALDIISGVLLGCNELHSKHQLVHRDLKPGNILLDIAANRSIIADLGAVKKITDPHKPVTATKATWIYLPPESIINDEYYFQSDLYQIGIAFYQVLGGHFPLYQQTEWLNIPEQRVIAKIRNSIERENKFAEMLSDKIVKGKLIQPSTLPAYLDPTFKRILSKALHLDHTKRFQNAAEFLKAIHELKRSFPNYIKMSDHLLVAHNDGREFKITVNAKGKYELEKKLTAGWRNSNQHSGTLDAVLSVARGY